MNRSQLVAELWHLKENVRRAKEVKDVNYLNKIQIFENFLVAHGPQIVDEMKDMFSDLATYKLKHNSRQVGKTSIDVMFDRESQREAARENYNK